MKATALSAVLAAAATLGMAACSSPPLDPGSATPGDQPGQESLALAANAGDLVCGAGGAKCSAADQCCSNRCDIVEARSSTGICRGLDVLEGPLAELPQAIKASDLRLTPPSLLDLQAARGPNGGSLLFARFAKDRRLGRQVLLAGERGGDLGDLTLHDDGEAGDERAGDGVFTVAVPLDFDGLRQATAERLTRLRRLGRTSIPIFQGRQQVGVRKIDFDLPFDRFPIFPFPIPFFVDEHRSLAVTHLDVVEDGGRTFNPCTGVGTPMGKWTFGYLMTQMANEPVTGTNPSDFVHNWVSRWLAAQPVGITSAAPPRPTMASVISAWPKLPDGRLDLARAPFKLLAIMNRIDLAGNPSYGAVSGAEGRFVFELLDQATCSPRSFLAILEYGVPRHTCGQMKSWAQQWLDLGTLPLGSAAYNDALEAITEQFAAANADLGKFNGSAINQVRTNEVALAFPWELREFKLFPMFPETALLREATVKQTPDRIFNGTKPGSTRAGDLATWINANLAAVTAGAHSVPPIFPFPPGGDFLGASTTNEIDFWNAPGIVNTARFKFSLNTCNGCHGRETNTSFTMVNIAPFGSEATLAGFLTGEVVLDPGDLVTMHPFHDLLDRAGKLQAFADAFCGPFPFPFPFPLPIKMVPPFPLPPISIRPMLAGH